MSNDTSEPLGIIGRWGGAEGATPSIPTDPNRPLTRGGDSVWQYDIAMKKVPPCEDFLDEYQASPIILLNKQSLPQKVRG